MSLLYKELALAAHPTLFIFTLLGCLVIVPSYPFTVIFMFGCLAPYITFTFARENNDAWYTATLPVTKREIIQAKCLLIVCSQIVQLIVSIPFAILRAALHIGNNPVGIDATVAWYGFGLIIYSVFDLIFFSTFYKSGYKAGKAFCIAMLPVLLLMILVEGSVHIPLLSWLDSCAPDRILRQIPILLTGIICYSAGILVTKRIASRRFEKVDL